ncbi:cupredoxin domain-containing protein [Metallibacterium sp.]|uniref:cupredoxin domain-containing protein n=3 Tax=Metallibacterium sp. TaxID=2940281 RepID=UPI0026075EAB|nr:cupredoxin domain-containing protein [Metallibacterium sp.]
MPYRIFIFLSGVLAFAAMNTARIAVAAEPPSFRLAIVNHRFQPATLTIPANTKVKLVVENRDATPEEFESNDFDREKVILPNSSAVIFVGPLRPGQYRFFGEFNPATAQGVLRVE